MKKKFNTVSLEPYSVHAKTQRIWTTMKMAHRWPNSFFKKRHIKEHKLQTQLLPFVVPGSLTLANIPAATQARCLGRHHPWFPLLLNLQINQAPNIFLPKKSQIHAHDHSPTISLAYCDTFLWFHYWWYFSSSITMKRSYQNDLLKIKSVPINSLLQTPPARPLPLSRDLQGGPCVPTGHKIIRLDTGRQKYDFYLYLLAGKKRIKLYWYLIYTSALASLFNLSISNYILHGMQF